MAPPANVGDWDYTDAEWLRICAAIKRVRSDPLNDTERDALRITANDYIVGLRDKSTKRYTLADERRAWEKVSKKIFKLQEAIQQAAAIRSAIRSHTENQELVIVSEEIEAAVLGKPQPPSEPIKIRKKGNWKEIPIPHFSLKPHVMSIDDLGVLLTQLKFQIDQLVVICSSGPAYCWSYTGRLEPRVVYMQQILWLWTDRFGGKLTLSNDSTRIPARIHGPLVDYVSVVAGPVMKNAAPKPSSLPDVVERQKEILCVACGLRA